LKELPFCHPFRDVLLPLKDLYGYHRINQSNQEIMMSQPIFYFYEHDYEFDLRTVATAIAIELVKRNQAY